MNVRQLHARNKIDIDCGQYIYIYVATVERGKFECLTVNSKLSFDENDNHCQLIAYCVISTPNCQISLTA
jgi:hypothetical protein